VTPDPAGPAISKACGPDDKSCEVKFIGDNKVGTELMCSTKEVEAGKAIKNEGGDTYNKMIATIMGRTL
jgi:hypothetical protein